MVEPHSSLPGNPNTQGTRLKLSAAKPAPQLGHYLLVTAAYWVFTLTDGALRMLVLLELHERGFSPFALATVFVSYELAGILTNLVGGWIGAHTGLRATLLAGMGLQALVLASLACAAPTLTLPILLAAQVASGVAKDLTKMSAKSFVRLVVPKQESSQLMRWVAILTGSKNALKGVGFFLGGWLLVVVGFQQACALMGASIVLAWLIAALGLPAARHKGESKVSLRHLLSNHPRINWLSSARVFLFGSRDAWFTVALPVFLASELGWSHTAIGAFLAFWVIGYGFIQASAPHWVGGARLGPLRSRAPEGRSLIKWSASLLLPITGLLAALQFDAAVLPSLIVSLSAFAALFASCSAIHSYLIVHYSSTETVSLTVGSYYAANALGRLCGTVLSGWAYQAAGQGTPGLQACLIASAVLVLFTVGASWPLRSVG